MTTLGMAKDQLVKLDLATSRPPESVGGSVVGAHDPEDSAAQGFFGALITVQSNAACFRRLPASSDFGLNALQMAGYLTKKPNRNWHFNAIFHKIPTFPWH